MCLDVMPCGCPQKPPRTRECEESLIEVRRSAWHRRRVRVVSLARKCRWRSIVSEQPDHDRERGNAQSEREPTAYAGGEGETPRSDTEAAPRNRRLLECAARPSARTEPIAARMPRPFQYPNGSERR